MRTYANREKVIMSLWMLASHVIFLSKYLVHKLLAIITRFFVVFVKISVLLKIFVLRNEMFRDFFVWFIGDPDCWLLKSCFQKIKYLDMHWVLTYLWQRNVTLSSNCVAFNKKKFSVSLSIHVVDFCFNFSTSAKHE